MRWKTLRLLLKPEWWPAFHDHGVRWLKKRLPEDVKKWLRDIAGETPFISKSLLMKAAEEMFIRKLLNVRELVKLESTLGGPHFPAGQVRALVNFIESGDWSESTPEWDKLRKTLRKGYTDSEYVGPDDYTSNRTAAPRTKPLKGSKASEQQVAGYPKSRLGIDHLAQRRLLQEKLEELLRRYDDLGVDVAILEDEIEKIVE